ncbi:ABC transporter substrate-binding protein [Streptomyces sp. NPDC051738]|uniref:ABC transporter substrate-binding protein n=1 Tax=Streptomyces sp. NPDC051738 TaxID=3365672 RepID=UPI0037D6EDFA
MLNRFRNRALGPADKALVLAVGVALLAAIAFVVVQLLPEECGGGLEAAGDECVGVTAGVLPGDPELEGLIRAVADENARVEKSWTDPENGQASIPYVRIALMMPFTTDATSTMSTEQIARALAGAHAAQLRANEQAGPRYQLLLANDGKDLDEWAPVVDRLAGMTDDKAPLVGVFGMPSSTPDTLDAAHALSAHRIPTIGPILTSTTMEAGYLFKTSPSNDLFAEALREYLDKNPGHGTGFLVSDRREQDSYSADLREVFLAHFGKEYGLKQRQASYLGLTGDDEGVPQRFSDAARSICLTEADTVFFAGRDHDLPHLVDRLANEPSCDHGKPTRILKVGIGMAPETTTADVTEQLREARITLVDAASVDTRSWAGNEKLAAGPRGFLKQFEKLRAKLRNDAADKQPWGNKPLDDGYAVMYYDAFTVLSQATGRAYDDINGERMGTEGEAETSSAPILPKHDDVYNTVINMNILGTQSGASCVNCVRGASGTFGFDDSPDTRKWAVCKPVPVIEYPKPASGTKAAGIYRSHEDIFNGTCP